MKVKGWRGKGVEGGKVENHWGEFKHKPKIICVALSLCSPSVSAGQLLALSERMENSLWAPLSIGVGY